MALVRITATLVNSMCNLVRTMYDKEKEALPRFPTTLETELAEYLLDRILPLEIDVEVQARLPTWAYKTISSYDVRIEGRMFKAKSAHNRYYSGNFTTIHGVPGVGKFRVAGDDIFLEGTLSLPHMHPLLRKHIEAVRAVADAHLAFTEKVKEAEDKMRTFLCQHTTLQSAMKAFGPALWEFVPSNYREQYERIPERKARSTKTEKNPQEIDMSDLIGKIAAKKLALE